MKHRKYLMDKLDSYGDNFRNIPICVPNETERDAQLFKEKIANRATSTYAYHYDDQNSNRSNISSISNLSMADMDRVQSWKAMALNMGGSWDGILSDGHKKSKKIKKEKKEAKRFLS